MARLDAFRQTLRRRRDDVQAGAEMPERRADLRLISTHAVRRGGGARRT